MPLRLFNKFFTESAAACRREWKETIRRDFQ